MVLVSYAFTDNVVRPMEEPAKLLKTIDAEARSKARFNVMREGMFRGVLKAAFVRSFEARCTCIAHETFQSQTPGKSGFHQQFNRHY